VTGKNESRGKHYPQRPLERLRKMVLVVVGLVLGRGTRGLGVQINNLVG